MRNAFQMFQFRYIIDNPFDLSNFLVSVKIKSRAVVPVRMQIGLV